MIPRSLQKTIRLYRNRLSAWWWSPNDNNHIPTISSNRQSNHSHSRQAPSSPRHHHNSSNSLCDDYYGYPRSRREKDRDRDRSNHHRRRDSSRDYYYYYDDEGERERDHEHHDSDYYDEEIERDVRHRSAGRNNNSSKRKFKYNHNAHHRSRVSSLMFYLLSLCFIVSFLVFTFRMVLSSNYRKKVHSFFSNRRHHQKLSHQLHLHQNHLHPHQDESNSKNEKKYDPQHPSSLIVQAPPSVQVPLTKSAQVQDDNNVMSNDSNTRTCYTSGISHAGVCVHSPVCMAEDSTMVYLAKTLRCSSYTNGQGEETRLTENECVELEKKIEQSSLISSSSIEHKSNEWLKNEKYIWFDNQGDSILLKLSSKASNSLIHFISRIFMLHHVIQNYKRYGFQNGIRYIIIDTNEHVNKKLKYSKSWQHGLLNAIIYPHKPIYNNYKQLHQQVISNHDYNSMIVFITNNNHIHKQKSILCFNRLGMFTPSIDDVGLFLQQREYPGIITNFDTHNTQNNMNEYKDAVEFRKLLYASLGYSKLPKTKPLIIYLHRSKTRTFSPDSLTLLQQTLSKIARQHDFELKAIDISIQTFPKQMQSVCNAAILIGLHGIQMLNSLFLSNSSTVIEIFPYKFSNDLLVNSNGGTGIRYERYQVVHGEEYPNLMSHFQGDVKHCQEIDMECRKWYQSDNRPILFHEQDAKAISIVMQQALQHVKQLIIIK